MMQKAWSSIEEVPCCISRSSVKFQGHTGHKIVDFEPNWAFPVCNSSLISLMAMTWCTKLEVAYKRGLIIFQGHPSNVNVTQDKKSMILNRIERFRTVTPVWIHQWLWNDARSLIYYRIGALLSFYIIHQMSRSHRPKNREDLNPIYVRFLGRSQLSSPSDLPCYG